MLGEGCQLQVPRCRSGFRRRAPASLTPAQRLKFDSRWRYQVMLGEGCQLQVPRPDASGLGISPAGSRFAHARSRWTRSGWTRPAAQV